MINIEGKTIVTTDWHFGLKNNDTKKIEILTNVINQIDEFSIQNKCSNLIFGGDLFDNRKLLSPEVINVAIESINKLAKHLTVYLILGNHDIYYKNSNSIYSTKIFENTRNVYIIKSITECSINGNKSLFVPWNSELTKYKKYSFDMMFGHFDIPEEYFHNIRINKNINHNKIIEEERTNIEDNDFLSDIIPDGKIKNNEESSEINAFYTLKNTLLLVKEKGTIFAGHIHSRKEENVIFDNEVFGRTFIFVGSPYQQNFGEEDSIDGIYLIDTKNNISFHQLANVPVHLKISISDIVKDIDNFKFSNLFGNIVRIKDDIDIDDETQNKIHQKITDALPFEKETEICTRSLNITNQSEVIDCIKKTPWGYIKDYIMNKISTDLIEKKELDRNVLLKKTKQVFDESMKIEDAY